MKLSCDDLAQLQRILTLLGKADAAKTVAKVAAQKGCLLTTAAAAAGELIL